jgi:hypothetical protein
MPIPTRGMKPRRRITLFQDYLVYQVWPHSGTSKSLLLDRVLRMAGQLLYLDLERHTAERLEDQEVDGSVHNRCQVRMLLLEVAVIADPPDRAEPATMIEDLDTTIAVRHAAAHGVVLAVTETEATEALVQVHTIDHHRRHPAPRSILHHKTTTVTVHLNMVAVLHPNKTLRTATHPCHPQVISHHSPVLVHLSRPTRATHLLEEMATLPHPNKEDSDRLLLGSRAINRPRKDTAKARVRATADRRTEKVEAGS